MTLRAGLIGAHISRTRLPAALKIMCDAEGIDLEFDLIDTNEIQAFDFGATLERLRREGWTGVSVTHPFKAEAARFAGTGMGVFAHLGACNTLIFGADLTGANTDYTGFLAAFKNIEARGPVVMIGAGGVARAIAAALVEEKVEALLIHDRDRARAEDLACSIGPPARAIPETALEAAIAEAEGLVNATPLGMVEYPGSAFPARLLGPQKWAFDAVYTPTDTQFLKDCGQAGLARLTGFDLFRHMAIRTFAAYTGVAPNEAETLDRLEELRP